MRGANTVKSCIIRNVPVGVTGGYRAIDGHKVLVAPTLTGEDDYDVERIADYVRNGGRLYFSGAHNEKMLELFFVAKKGWADKGKSCLYCSQKESRSGVRSLQQKYPLSFSGSAPVVEGIDDACVIQK